MVDIASAAALRGPKNVRALATTHNRLITLTPYVMSTTASNQTHGTSSTRQPSSRNRLTGAKRGKRQEAGVSCCGGCVKSFEVAVERADKRKRERKGPKSWLERKFAIGMVIALFGWSNYGFWGIILRSCWYGTQGALVSFAAGIVLSIIYGFLVLMFVVTYLKIILTSPGFARDYVQPSDPPLAPEPPPLSYNHAYDPEPSYHHQNDIYDGSHDGRVVYPPSRKAPTSEYRQSMEDADRLTHETTSLDDHGEFEDKAEPVSGSGTKLGSDSKMRLGVGHATNGNRDLLGVPYELMPTRPLPVHTRSRSASNTAIPPSTPKPSRQRSNSTTYPPTPTTPATPTSSGVPTSTAVRPEVLKKDLKRGSVGSPASPTQASPSWGTGASEMKEPVKRPSNLVRPASSSSRATATTTAHPSPPTRTSSPTSRQSPDSKQSPTATTDNPSATMGFQYESKSYILDPPRLSFQSHTRTKSDPQRRARSDSQTRNANVPSFEPSPTTPTDSRAQVRSSTPVLAPSTSHNLPGRSKRANTMERPVPYLDDLPPIAPAPPPHWGRVPPSLPVLEPHYRYCSRDGILKPPRCHHCRICNTCVLGYDHHCPWVGGCVGAQNRKFFVVFLFWSTLYLLYTLSLLIAAIASRAAIAGPVPLSSSSLDPNLLALLVTTVLFCTFSGGMLAMHVHLLRRNASTVEWRGVQDIRERERAVISQVVPVCACLGMGEGERGNGGLLGQKEERGWADDELVEVQKALPKGFKGRRALRRQWDAEWGRIGKEGNLWWLGSDLENWESVMGKNAWTWFLPVGDFSAVGVDYPRNPRFDKQGRWRKRSDWPEELR